MAQASDRLNTLPAVQLAREQDPEGNRTACVLTKVDLLKTEHFAMLAETMMGNVVEFKHPISGVSCINNDPSSDLRAVAEACDRSLQSLRLIDVSGRMVRPEQLGIQSLRIRLNQLLEKVMKSRLPFMVRQLQERLNECIAAKAALGEQPPTESMAAVAFLQKIYQDILVKRLVGGLFDLNPKKTWSTFLDSFCAIGLQNMKKKAEDTVDSICALLLKSLNTTGYERFVHLRKILTEVLEMQVEVTRQEMLKRLQEYWEIEIMPLPGEAAPDATARTAAARFMIPRFLWSELLAFKERLCNVIGPLARRSLATSPGTASEAEEFEYVEEASGDPHQVSVILQTSLNPLTEDAKTVEERDKQTQRIETILRILKDIAEFQPPQDDQEDELAPKLRTLGLTRVPTQARGDCMYEALARGLRLTDSAALRQTVMTFIERDPRAALIRDRIIVCYSALSEWLVRNRQNGEWGGEEVLLAMSILYPQHSFVVISPAVQLCFGSGNIRVIQHVPKTSQCVYLLFNGINHYDGAV